MTEAVSSTSQLSRMEQQLYSARQALDELNEAQNIKLQALLQFIGHLSLACKGQNLELDNKLAKLRHKLNRFNQIDTAMPDLFEAEGILKQQHAQIILQLEESRRALSSMIGQVQRLDSLPLQLKKEIAYFKKELNKPLHTYWDYIPKVKQFLHLYNQIIHEQLKLGDQFEVLPKHHQSILELEQLLSEIEFSASQREKIDAIKNTLTDSFDLDTLLNAYQAVLHLLLDNIAKEKTAAQTFLHILEGTIVNVREVVTDSYGQSIKGFHFAKKLNAEINLQVDNIDNSLANIDDIDDLKQHVNTQLLALRTALNRKEALESHEQQQRRRSTDTLRVELNKLNKETESYKERLFEQQKLNLLDTLTQLPNRAALQERMDVEYRNHKRTQQPLWVAVVDIDHFKSINDNFGHSTGDRALQVIAMALKNSLRETEFVARFGGEEFVFLLPNINNNDIRPLLNRVREKIKSIPFKFKNEQIMVTVSIGAAQIMDNELITETFERADAALYKAKHESRDRVVIDI